MLSILRWPKNALMSINASWFWCAQNHWAREAFAEQDRPRVQIIRQATLWQRWLLWLQQHLRYVCIVLVLLAIGISMAMSNKQAEAAAPSSPVWAVPVEPPGVVVVTHNSATALAAKYKPAAQPETERSTGQPLPGATTQPSERHVAQTKESSALVAGAASQASLEKALQDWSQAWQQKNVPAYLAMYATDFETPKGQSRQAWAQMRTQRIQSKRSIQHDMRQMRVSLTGVQAHVSFEQRYADERLQQTDQKTMLWVWREGQWRIARETTS
jgi:ketosteroid isomerase-like protein